MAIPMKNPGMTYGSHETGATGYNHKISSSININDVRYTVQKLAKSANFSRFVGQADFADNQGKLIRGKIYTPILSDRNINDQGINAQGVKTENGNFYGESRDINAILESAPILSAVGGTVNRAGFSEYEITGTLTWFGIHIAYDRELVMYESNHQFLEKFRVEQVIETAHRMYEDYLGIDIINSAGTLAYPGNATKFSQIGKDNFVTYNTFTNLHMALDHVGCPRQTNIVKGSSNYDTIVNRTDRVLITHERVIYLLETLRDNLGNPAFKPIEKYAAGLSGGPLEDEYGSIGRFRIVCPQRMFYWAGAGATVAPTDKVEQTKGRADLYPMVYIGPDAFNTIRFTGIHSKSFNFSMIHQRPDDTSATQDEPFGMKGFVSIKWLYGSIVTHPERIGLIVTALPTLDYFEELLENNNKPAPAPVEPNQP